MVVQGGAPGQAVQELRAGVRAESQAARLHPPPDRGHQVPGRPSAGPPELHAAGRGGGVFQSGDGTRQTGHWADSSVPPRPGLHKVFASKLML